MWVIRLFEGYFRQRVSNEIGLHTCLKDNLYGCWHNLFPCFHTRLQDSQCATHYLFASSHTRIKDKLNTCGIIYSRAAYARLQDNQCASHYLLASSHTRKCGAEKRTWTSTGRSPLAPEASASTNSATSAWGAAGSLIHGYHFDRARTLPFAYAFVNKSRGVRAVFILSL